jgi:hypothetical protein
LYTLFFNRRSPFEVSLWKAASYAISTLLSFLTIREYVDKGAAFYELKHRELQVHQLKWKAAGSKSPDANNV